jgi:putative phosphoesterase
MKSKKILLCSDTHSFFDDSLWPYVAKSDEVWHAGDVGDVSIIDRLNSSSPKVRAVYGNIDGGDIRLLLPEFQILSYGNLKVMMIHIAGSLGRYNAQVRELISMHHPNVLVCGHSHILKIGFDTKFNLLYMNPGACGHHGFHKIRTVLKFCMNEEKIHSVEVVELGKRGRK